MCRASHFGMELWDYRNYFRPSYVLKLLVRQKEKRADKKVQWTKAHDAEPVT